MAAVVTVTESVSIGETRHLYWGTIAFDASYPTGGEALDATANTRFEFLQAQLSGGYVFTWDTANQKLLAYYADNNNASDGPLIQVPDTTDLSALTAIPFFAIGA